MGKTATQNGKDFEINLWDYLSKPGFRKNLIQANVGLDDFTNIDSKDKNNKKNITLKKELHQKFIKEHKSMPGMRFASALRGDILCNILGIIIDIKNYASVQGTMKLKELKLEDYIKGFDSNIKYPLFYKLDNFDFIDDHADHLNQLRDFLISKIKNIDWFKNEFQPKFKNGVTVAYMTPINFADFFCFNECGFAWNYSGVKPIKGFFSKVEDTVEFKVIDFTEIKSSFIEVKLTIDEKGYIFINFYDGDECVYIISQRGWDEQRSKRFGSNCSFIKKSAMTLVSKIEIPKDE